MPQDDAGNKGSSSNRYIHHFPTWVSLSRESFCVREREQSQPRLDSRNFERISFLSNRWDLDLRFCSLHCPKFCFVHLIIEISFSDERLSKNVKNEVLSQVPFDSLVGKKELSGQFGTRADVLSDVREKTLLIGSS